ncbi:MAG: LptF/LptG family permease [Armatimonadota bacterium]
MRTLDKYVLKEMIGPFLVSVFAFVVLLIGRVIFDNINFILEKNVPLNLVIRLIIFQMPMIIGMVLPLATLFSTSLAVNRLGRESETTAMRMAGIPLRRIFLPIFIVSIIASAVTLWLGESVTPWANREAGKTMRYIWGLQPVPPVQENLFFQSEGHYFYVQRVERSDAKHVILRKVMIYEIPAINSFPMLTTAEWATNKDNLWTLHNGVQHKLDESGFSIYEMKFDKLNLNLKRAMQALWETQKSTEEMGFRELQEKISVFKGAAQDVAKMKVDWHFKLSIPLSCLIFALCAAPLSMKFSRIGSYSGILLGVIIMFLYWNNILLGKALGLGLVVPPALAGWSQNIIFGLGGIILLWREE